MDEIFKSIHNLLINSIENLNENHITNITSSIINSIPIPQDEKDFYTTSQNLHIDYKEMTIKHLTENKYPLSVIIALEDNTVLRILTKSHKLFDATQDQKEVAEVIMNLKKGQIFIFHPNLIHSGWS
jgi:ectoine hydroxylase-related dioxygenase (phytanoyl-CoA dioxygenase family)